MNRSTSLKPYSTLFLYLMGFAVGCSVIYLDYWVSFTENRHWDFIKKPKSQIWFLTIFMQTIFWFAVLVPLYRIRRFLMGEYQARRSRALDSESAGEAESARRHEKFWFYLAAFLFLIAFVFLRLLTSFSPACGDYDFLHSGAKTSILTWIGFGIASIAAVELLLIGVELARIFEEGAASENCVAAFITLRRYSLRLLTILGVMTTLAVLSMTAKRYAIRDVKNCIELLHIFLYALFLSMLLAFGFFPTYAALLRTGHKLVRELLPMPPPTDEMWPNWYQRKKGLEELLQLTPTENLRAGIAILSPIAGGVISWLSTRLPTG